MAAETASENQVTVEDIGPSRKKLTITIPSDRVSEQIDLALGTVAAEAEIKGFRKGRVPKHIVNKMFGQAVRAEAKNQLVSSAYADAVEREGLKVLSEPEGAEELKDLDLDPNEDVTFTVEVEVAPEFELPELEKIAVRKPLFEVTDEQVDEQIERMRQNEGELEPQEKAEPGDFVIGRATLTIDDTGEQVHDIEGAVIQVPTEDKGGKGMILGVSVEDFGEQVGLPANGDELTVKTTGPESHENESIRGKALTATIQAERVERIVPAEVSALVERFGLTDERQLRESITLQLNNRVVVEQQSAMRQQVADYLLDNVSMDLPEGVTASQAERNIQRTRMELMYRGVPEMEIEQRLAEVRAHSEDRAARELRLFFILAKVAEKFEIGVEQDEISARVAQIAAERQTPPRELYEQLAKNNQLQMIGQQIREHKAVDEILSRADISEVSPDEWKTYAEERRERGGSAD